MPPGTTWQFPYLIILHAWSVRGRYSVRHRPRLRSTFTGCLIYLSVLRGVREEL